MHHRLGEEARCAIDSSGCAQRDDRQKLLAETGESRKRRVVNERRGRDLGMVRDVAMRELATHNIFMLRERRKRRRQHFHIIGDAGIMVHHDGNWALVRNMREPLDNALLRARSCEVSWDEHEAPLRAGLFGAFELIYDLLDVLGGGAGDDGVVFEACVLEGLADGGEDRETLGVAEVDGFAGAAEDHEAFDAGLCEVEGVCGLGVEVERCGDLGGRLVCCFSDPWRLCLCVFWNFLLVHLCLVAVGSSLTLYSKTERKCTHWAIIRSFLRYEESRYWHVHTCWGRL